MSLDASVSSAAASFGETSARRTNTLRHRRRTIGIGGALLEDLPSHMRRSEPRVVHRLVRVAERRHRRQAERRAPRALDATACSYSTR